MSQRTKGNAKPSNSERAARLLPKNQFLSFSEASQTLSPIYAAAATMTNGGQTGSQDGFEFDISSDFQIIFKHMSKKDINTKLKALQDFAALCLTKEKDELLKCARFWFRVYRKLANSIDWRLRQEVHLTNYKFLSSFDREAIIGSVQISSGLGEPNSDSNTFTTSDVSFSNLITMPAILWASCFDAYTQGADSAKKALEFLYPTTDSSYIEFMLNNYDSILNYFIYSIFDKIPINLFYSTPLPADSVKVFEEHILVTSLKGLSSLINELLSYYLKNSSSGDEALKTRTLNCLQSIFLRLNTEFVNRKNFGKPNPNVASNLSEENTTETPKENEPVQYLSKKEKRKQQKNPTENKTCEKKDFKICKFWPYSSSPNNTIRVAFFHALNSIVRLTSFHYYHSDADQKFKQTNFQELIDSKILWHQLYQNNFYDIILKNFTDSVPEIRGLCWLLVTHLLPKRELYNPWLVQKPDKFLDSLVQFISNGMKTAGGLVDFGLFNINLEKYQLIYSEFFASKYSHLSALQLTNEAYSELNVLANVKLVVVFVESFNTQQEYRFQIYRTLLSGLNDGFKRVVLQKDMDFLVEIYFNLIYHLLQKCLQLSRTKELEMNVKLSEKTNINSLIADIFGKYLHSLLITSFEHPSELYFNSLIYLNLLLLTHYSNEFYQKLCKDPQYDTGYLSIKYNEFKSCLMGLYLEMFKLIETELSKSYTDAGSRYSLNRMLRFLNDSTLFRQDGYFSPQYYCSRNSFNYDKLTLKVLRTNLQQSTLSTSKRVSFDLNSVNIVPSSDSILNQVIPSVSPSNQKLVATKSWWATQQQKSMFAFSLLNSKYKTESSSSNNKSLSISLYNEFLMLDNSLNQNVVNLIKLFEYKLNNFESDGASADEDELFLIIQHLQYILRGVSCDNFVKIFSSIQSTGENCGDLIPDIENVITHFIQNCTNKWFDRCFSLCDKIYQSESPSQQSLRFQVLICRKISDVFLVIFSKISDSEHSAIVEKLMAEFVTNLKPFAFCVLIHHFSHLATLPTSAQYTATIDQSRQFLVESFFSIDLLLYSQLEQLFTNSTKPSASLDRNIFIDLLSFLLGQGKFLSDHSIDTEYKLKTIGQVLTRLYQQLKQFESDARTKSADFDYQFLVDFPVLCSEIYKIMFQQLENLSFIDNFEETFANFVKLFFRQTFHTISIVQSDEDDVANANCLKTFAANTSNFWSFGIEKFFYTLPRYETIFKILVKDLTSYVMNHIIFADSLVFSSFDLVNKEVSQFMNVLIFGYKSILSSCSLDNDCDQEEIAHVQQQFVEMQTKFFQHFNAQTKSFFDGNFIAYLYEMVQEDDSEFTKKLYSIHDLFVAGGENPKLELLNNADKFQGYVADKFILAENCLYLNYNMATIVENLLKNVYLDSVYENFISIESAQFLKYKAFTATNFKLSGLFQIVRQLFVNYYHLKNFLNFYFFQKQSQNNDPAYREKHQQMLKVFFSFKLEMNSILNLIATCLEKSSNCKDSVLEFICFLITSQDGTIPNLSYANFCIETHFPEFRWMDVLNHIGLDPQYDISNMASPSTCLFLASTDNVGRMVEVFDKSIEHLEEKATELVSTDNLNDELKKSIDWSKINRDELNKFLFVANFAVGKYAKLMLNKKLEEYPYFSSRIAHLLTLLANSKFDKLFNSSDLNFTNQSCATFALFGLLYRQYILCNIESFRPLHFASIFTVLKSWLQILYTALPENIEKASSQQIRVLLVGIDVLDTFNLFSRNAVLLLVADIDNQDTLPEAREMWRNFLAFDSFNMLLPLFIVMNNSPNRNMVEQAYLNSLTTSMQYVDVECLQDIASLELNQLLLISPDETTTANNNTIFRSQNILAKFLQDSSKTAAKSSKKQQQNLSGNSKIIYLRPSNPYYEFVLKYSTYLLFHHDFKWSMSSYRLLATMIQASPWLNEEKLVDIVDDQDQSDTSLLKQQETILAPPEHLCNLLEQLDKVVEYTLMEYEFGQTVLVDPNTDIYNCTLTYLLGWLLYIHLVECSPLGSDDPNETRADLINFLSKGNLHHRLFDNLFHLMMTDDDAEQNDDDDSENKNPKQDSIEEFLRKVNNLDNLTNIHSIIVEPNSISLCKLALCVYFQLLCHVPNVLRSWFNNLKPQQKAIVDEFTTDHFSTLLIENELDNFKQSDQTQFGNINVRVNKKTNEINAIYSLREICFGFKFDFKPNYPLTTIGIECSNRSGVGEERCRKWIQRLTIFFNKQNCSIKDGIIMLRPNMDKFFEDIEECLICLFVLYGSTSQLPRFKCPQCRKKFHWNCIRKWFHTNPSCPQCKYDFD